MFRGAWRQLVRRLRQQELMYIVLEYVICILLTLLAATILFALSAALIMVQEGVLLVEGIIRSVLKRQGRPAPRAVGEPAIQGT